MQAHPMCKMMMCASIFLCGHSLRLNEDFSHKVNVLKIERSQTLAPSDGPWNDKGLELLIKLGFQPTYVLDIGANVGDWTREHMKLFPNAHFLMVDGSDHKEQWNDLLQTGFVDGEIAILDKIAHNVTWYGTGGTGDSMHQELTEAYQNVSGQLIQTQTIDGLLQKHKWTNAKIGLVKLDVQGAELDILQGAPPELLTNTDVIVMEMPIAAYNKDAPSFSEYVIFMDNAGFAPWDIPELHRVNQRHEVGNDGYLFQVDFVFVRKNSRYWNAVQEAIAGVR